MSLPIALIREEIVTSVKENKVTILVGETGCGKTTQLPIYLYQAGLVNGGLLGITQPRRIAAISVAEFVSKQLGGNIGSLVGYQIRFDDQTADSTKIKFMTDGILLREMQIDPDLSKYSIIVIDEAHERSQNIDFVLGMVKDLLARRGDLKVVVTSATIDQEKFSKYFWNAPIINIAGRIFPVETVWSESDCYYEDVTEEIACRIINIHCQNKTGDILVFTAGIDDIKKIIETVEKKMKSMLIDDIVLLPAHGSLDPDNQRKIFETYPGRRKVVVATNIAETSITLDNTVYVIDSGFIKQSNFHPNSGIQSLDLVDHSQAGCEQRKGRAGRTQFGVCYRMYTEQNYLNRQPFTTPEIMRTSLANVVLMMEDIGIENIIDFDFIDRPDEAAFREAYETLIALGAIKKGLKGLTEIGKSMAKLPLEPRIARMLLEAEKYECVDEVATVAAFLSAKNVFSRPKGSEYTADIKHLKFKNEESDVLTFLSVWDAYQASGCSQSWCFENFLNYKTLDEISKIRLQIIDILKHNGIEISGGKAKPEKIMRAVAIGLVYNLFIKEMWARSHRGLLRKTRDIYIHPGSSVFRIRPKCFVAAKILRTSKNFAHIVTEVPVEWLKDMVPELCTFGTPELVSFDESTNMVFAKRKVSVDGELISEEELTISIEEADKIQRQRIKKAEADGLVPLMFKIIGDGFWKEIIATHENKPISASFYDVEEGATYYCKIDFYIGEWKANPIFKVIQLPVGQQSAAGIESPALKLDLSGLSAKWGKK